MAAKTRIFHPTHPGTWPKGEPQSTRDAYDKQFATEQAAKKQGDKKDGRR